MSFFYLQKQTKSAEYTTLQNTRDMGNIQLRIKLRHVMLKSNTCKPTAKLNSFGSF